MLHLMPAYIPPPGQLLAALEVRPPAVARALCVSERSVWRWLADDAMPRPAACALWWLSPWGRSVLVSDAEYRIHLAEATAEAVRAELTAERAMVARLLRSGASFGAANSPRMVG
jgi:hypothetical protein